MPIGTHYGSKIPLWYRRAHGHPPTRVAILLPYCTWALTMPIGTHFAAKIPLWYLRAHGHPPTRVPILLPYHLGTYYAHRNTFCGQNPTLVPPCPWAPSHPGTDFAPILHLGTYYAHRNTFCGQNPTLVPPCPW